MDMNELLTLRARFLAAKVNGHLIGAAAAYAEVLEKEVGPVHVGWLHSPEHLLALVDKAIRGRNAPKKAAQKPKPPKVDAKTASGILPEMPSEPKKPNGK